MFLSTTGKWLFLSNAKCGSTSIRRMLEPYATLAVKKPADGWHPHDPAVLLIPKLAAIGIDWNDLTTFTTIRNPWDRVVSAWEYGARNPASIWAKRRAKSRTFHNFVKSYPRGPAISRFAGEYPLFRPLVTHIVPIEKAAEELPPIFEQIGVPWTGLPHVNGSPRQRAHYREYYTPATREIVAIRFQSDIKLGRYRF